MTYHNRRIFLHDSMVLCGMYEVNVRNLRKLIIITGKPHGLWTRERYYLTLALWRISSGLFLVSAATTTNICLLPKTCPFIWCWASIASYGSTNCTNPNPRGSLHIRHGKVSIKVQKVCEQTLPFWYDWLTKTACLGIAKISLLNTFPSNLQSSSRALTHAWTWFYTKWA